VELIIIGIYLSITYLLQGKCSSLPPAAKQSCTENTSEVVKLLRTSASAQLIQQMLHKDHWRVSGCTVISYC